MIAGAIRVSTPFLFVSLGECLTEKSGRINLGLEGTLVFGAMTGYAISYETGSPWLGVLAAGVAGSPFRRVARLYLQAAEGERHRHRHRADAVRHRPRLLPRQAVHPAAGAAAAVDLARLAGPTCRSVQSALQVNPLFLVGVALAVVLWWAFRNTRFGLIVRMTGDSAPAALAMGYSVDWVRFIATTIGGFSAGVGGAFLSLYYPGSWSEGLSSGPGPDGGGACHLRALESARLLRRGAPLRRGRRARSGAAIGRRSRRAITSSTPRPTC